MKAPLFIEKIDWSDLRKQKESLLATITYLRTNKVVYIPDDLEGILSLIDAIQDYAVDEMNVREIDVFDFDLEDERELSVSTGIKATKGDELKIGDKVKTLWLCSNCGSDNVQFKTWTDVNSTTATDDEYPMEDDDCRCKDCERHVELYTAELKTDANVIGFQVVGEDGTPDHGDIHPRMKGSFCVYNLSQAREMLNDKHNQSSAHDSHWQLLTIWSGDIEEPTIMFDNSPRD